MTRNDLLKRVRYARSLPADASINVPPEPGKSPIPSDHIRLFHYDTSKTKSRGGSQTEEEVAAGFRQHGILTEPIPGRTLTQTQPPAQTQGQLFPEPGRAWEARAYTSPGARPQGPTQAEPGRVWAFTRPPGPHRTFVEFSVHKDDPRWGIGKPQTSQTTDRTGLGAHDRAVTFTDSIQPDEIIAVHEPWHKHYRHLEQRNLIPYVVAGKFDHVLGQDTPEARAVAYIKARHAGQAS